MSIEESTLDGVDAVHLQARITRPSGDPRGIVVVSHGLGAKSACCGSHGWTA